VFKFIHAADIHLDSPLHKLEAYEGAPVEEMRHATRRAFENLINLAIEEEVDFAVIAGDLYDSDWKDYNTGLYLVSQLTKLREAEIPVFIVAGNHDALSKITKTLRLPEGVTMFPSNKATTILIEELGIAIHGRSFSSAVMKKNLAQNYPCKKPGYFNIGLLHTSLNGREGHETYAPCSLDDLLNKGYDYWALGHAHKREIVHKQDAVIAFSGNTQGRHIRETGPKGTLIVNIDDAGKVRLDFRSLDVVRWEKLEVDASKADGGYMVVDTVTEQLETLAEKNDDLPLIVRVEILGNSPAHEELAGDVERWINEIRSAAIDSTHGSACIEKVMILTSYPSQEGYPSFKEGPIGELNQYLDSLESNPEQLLNLGSLLDDLMKKMPAELRQGGEGLNPGDPNWVAGIIRQIRPMLMQRLLGKGTSE